MTAVASDESIVSVTFNSVVANFHNIWLRDNCHCDLCYYPATKQRLLNSASIPDNIHAIHTDVVNGQLEIVWNDKHKSEYPLDWLHLHSYDPVLVPLEDKVQGEKAILARSFWQVKDIENNLPSVDFNVIMTASDDNEAPIKDWSMKIWKYGFCFIDNVPVTPQDTEKLCEKLSFIRPTHYGGFWDFTSDLSKADTAYTNIDISSHTDGTYWSDTPGLQLFHLLMHEGTGGTTSLVDAFKCAQILREQDPESFELLTRIPIPAHSAGEEKVCIQPDIPQPIFKLDNQGELIQVRWNQSDRSTMDNWKDPADIPRFYKAIKKWYSIISDKENEIFYQLRPGQCLIFDNWRCFHSRTEFTGKRRMCGAYINRDDFVSTLRILNPLREDGDLTWSPVPWVVESQVSLQFVNSLEVFFGQVEVSRDQVLHQSGLVVRLWNDTDASSGGPSQQDLSGGLVVFLSKSNNGLVGQQRWRVLGSRVVQFEVRSTTERGVTGNGNALVLDESDQLVSLQVWVVFDLQNSRNNAGLSQQVGDQTTVEVGDTDGLDLLTFLVDFFQSSPGVDERDVLEGELFFVTGVKTSWVFLLEGNEREGNWEVDQEQVKVFQLHFLQDSVQRWLHVGWVVVVVPQLGGDEQVFTLDQAIVEGLLQTVTDLDTVTVILSTVKQSVTRFNGVVDSVSTSFLVDFPHTEAYNRHLSTSI